MPVLQGFGRGDQRVLVNVSVPRRLSDEQRRLLEEFEAIERRGHLPARRELLRQAEERVPLIALRRVAVAGRPRPRRGGARDHDRALPGRLRGGRARGRASSSPRTRTRPARSACGAFFGGGRAADVEEGWEDRWRAFHRPVRVGRLWVGPPWEARAGDALAVVIDPGRAFGTGAHPTTQLCLELLQELEPQSLLDVGCGSGVLSVAAALLGFGPVSRSTSRRRRSRRRARTPRANGVELDVRLVDARRHACRARTSSSRTSRSTSVEALAARIDVHALVTSGYLASERSRAARLRARRAPDARRLGVRRLPRARKRIRSPPWRRSRVDFLGCKVSHVDAHEVRERLLARRPRRRPPTRPTSR